MITATENDSALRMQLPPMNTINDILKVYNTNLYPPDLILRHLIEFETDQSDL